MVAVVTARKGDGEDEAETELEAYIAERKQEEGLEMSK